MSDTTTLGIDPLHSPMSVARAATLMPLVGFEEGDDEGEEEGEAEGEEEGEEEGVVEGETVGLFFIGWEAQRREAGKRGGGVCVFYER